jgi:hypothetical protein
MKLEDAKGGRISEIIEETQQRLHGVAGQAHQIMPGMGAALNMMAQALIIGLSEIETEMRKYQLRSPYDLGQLDLLEQWQSSVAEVAGQGRLIEYRLNAMDVLGYRAQSINWLLHFEFPDRVKESLQRAYAVNTASSYLGDSNYPKTCEVTSDGQLNVEEWAIRKTGEEVSGKPLLAMLQIFEGAEQVLVTVMEKEPLEPYVMSEHDFVEFLVNDRAGSIVSESGDEHLDWINQRVMFARQAMSSDRMNNFAGRCYSSEEFKETDGRFYRFIHGPRVTNYSMLDTDPGAAKEDNFPMYCASIHTATDKKHAIVVLRRSLNGRTSKEQTLVWNLERKEIVPVICDQVMREYFFANHPYFEKNPDQHSFDKRESTRELVKMLMTPYTTLEQELTIDQVPEFIKKHYSTQYSIVRCVEVSIDPTMVLSTMTITGSGGYAIRHVKKVYFVTHLSQPVVNAEGRLGMNILVPDENLIDPISFEMSRTFAI